MDNGEIFSQVTQESQDDIKTQSDLDLWTAVSVIVLVLVLLTSSLKILTYLLLILLAAIMSVFAGIFIVRIPRNEISIARTRFPRFAFSKTAEEWNKEVDRLQLMEIYVPKDSTNFSPSIDRIVDLIIRDFVSSWFKSISSSSVFTNEVKLQLNDVFHVLEHRLSDIDISKLIVLDIIPLITKHFSNFLIAEETVVGENNVNSSSDLDLKISKEYDIISRTHRLINLKNIDVDSMKRNYSRDRVARFIKYLLSEEELNSRVVPIIVRELVSNVVLFPILSLLTDPDFWNQMIVKFAGITLKDRDQVRELRSYLDKQYKNPHQLHKPTTPTVSYSRVQIGEKRITPHMKQPEFESYIKSIQNSNSLPSLKQLRYFIAVQISRSKKITSTSDKFMKYLRRLEMAKDAVDGRIAKLTTSDLPGSEKRTSVILSNDDLEGFITTLSLSQILSNPSALSFFMKFMEQRSRIVLLQFWLVVNGIKDPLEDAQNPDYEEELASSADLSGAGDIEQIYKTYFNQKILRIKSSVYEAVREFATGEKRSIEDYLKVRKLILLLQIEVYKRMEDRDLSDFKNSDLFLKLLASETFEESLISQVDVLQDEQDEDREEVYEEADNSEGSLVEIENRLSKILTKEQPYRIPSHTSSAVDLTKSTSAGTEQLRNEIFGSSDRGFLDEKPLFEDSDDEYYASEVAPEDDELEADSEFFPVSHDAFNLKEEILKLDQDIKKLTDQSAMLDPLILKAELTDNLNELRLLRKSKSSFQREMERKELRRQQLIVQDNENSLFGKTSIAITSWIKGHSESKDFIVYVIEVMKSSTQEGAETTSWVVGRRFSQFYKLNEILKKDIPQISAISFPKKKIVLKFQQRSLIEDRRNQLEEFLTKLLDIPEVCQHKEFRKFLTVDDFKVSATYEAQSLNRQRFEIKGAAKNIYHGIYSGIDMLSSKNPSTDNLKNLAEDIQSHPDSDNVEEMRKELENFDYQPTKGSGSKSFIKPVTELFMALFPFNKTNSWLRGRAIIVVLQQVFGSTIEKYIKGQIAGLTTEDRIIDLIVTCQDILWPNGKFMESGSPRTTKDKIQTKQESKILLETLLVDTCSRIVGKTSSKIASNRLHAMLQNELLNNSLLYEMLDIVLESVFPELQGQL